MRKGGGLGFGGGKKRKPVGGGNAHNLGKPPKEPAIAKIRPAKDDHAVKPNLFQRISSGFSHHQTRVPKTAAIQEQQQQHRLQQQQQQPAKQAHRISPEIVQPARVNIVQQNNHGIPQHQPVRQDLTHLSPHGALNQDGRGWQGGWNGHPDERPRRHSAEPVRTNGFQNWPQYNQQHGNEMSPASRKYHPDYQQQGNMAQKPPRVNQQNQQQHVNSFEHPPQQRPARMPKKATYKVVDPPKEKAGNLVQVARVPDFVKEGAAAAGTALVEEVFTKGGKFLGRNFIGWWNGDDGSSDNGDSKKDDKANGNIQQPAPPVANQQPVAQQPVAQQPVPQQPVPQQPVPQQPMAQQPIAQQPHIEQPTLQPPTPILQQPAPIAPQPWQATLTTNYIRPTQSTETSIINPSPTSEGHTPSQVQLNVSTGDSLIFPSHFSLYPHTVVTWFDNSSKWQDDYLFFNAWNTTTSRSVLVFVAKKFVTMGFEHIDAHFKNVYPYLWWRDAKQDEGEWNCGCLWTCGV